MKWMKTVGAATLLLAGAACGRGAATSLAPPANPPSSSTSPVTSTAAAKGSYAPAVDFSTIDRQLTGLNSDLSGADQGLNSTQEGDVSK